MSNCPLRLQAIFLCIFKLILEILPRIAEEDKQTAYARSMRAA
jgi:hypothetical protein